VLKDFEWVGQTDCLKADRKDCWSAVMMAVMTVDSRVDSKVGMRVGMKAGRLVRMSVALRADHLALQWADRTVAWWAVLTAPQ
jgi:hypothetical protein